MLARDSVTNLLNDLPKIANAARVRMIIKQEARLEPGESRLAAMLFLDVVSFTELAQKLDSETLAQLINSAFEIFEYTVKSLGGYCDKVIGDAGLYIFGGHSHYPPAYEAALRAALELQERARQINESLTTSGLGFAVRIGVAVGEVTRRRIGGQTQQVTVMGSAVNLAQRLEASAEPGQILTTHRTLYHAGEHFKAKNLGKRELKGFDPVEVHELLAYTPPPVKLRGAYQQLSPLVGRSEEINQAYHLVSSWLALDKRDTGDGFAAVPMYVFSGPAAIGKSRLVHELSIRVGAKFYCEVGTLHLTKHTSPAELGAELCGLLGLKADNLVPNWQALTNTAQLAEIQHQACMQSLPMLAYLLRAPGIDYHGVEQASLTQFTDALINALVHVIELAAEHTNVVLILEDLQWLGANESLLAQLLTRAKPKHPLVLLASARPEADRELLKTVTNTTWYELAPLNVEDGNKLLERLLPGITLPPAVLSELHENAAGLPYYYEEFARMLHRHGLLAERQDGFEALSDLAQLEFPDNIHMLILGRIDQLEPPVRAVTEYAAVLGYRFADNMLKLLKNKFNPATNKPSVEASLKTLVAHQILQREDSDRYLFTHILTREAIYDSILHANRRLIHRLAAEVYRDLLIPGQADEEDKLKELAYHDEQAGSFLRAHFDCTAIMALQASAGRFERWDEWQSRAAANWCEVRAANTDLPAESAAVLYTQALRLANQGETERALRLCEQALIIVENHPELGSEDAIKTLAGRLHLRLGNQSEAQRLWLEILNQALDLNDEKLATAARGNLGMWHQLRGELEQAEQYYKHALASATKLNLKRTEARMRESLATLYMLKQEYPQATDMATQAARLHSETLNPRGAAIVRCNLAWMYEQQGKLDDALALNEQAAAEFVAVRDTIGEGAARNNIGSICTKLGKYDEAAAALSAAEELLRTAGDRRQLGFVLCDWVHYYVAQQELVAAARRLAAAEDLARDLKLTSGTELADQIEIAHQALRSAQKQHQ